jgi:hypothetical protein
MVHGWSIGLAALAFVALVLKVMFQWTAASNTYAVAPEMDTVARSVLNTSVNIGVPLLMVVAIILCACGK